MDTTDNAAGPPDRQHEHFLFQSLILDQIYDNVTVVDLNGTIIYVNRAECELMGCSREDLEGKHVSIYGDIPVDGEPEKPIFDQVLEKGRWRGEVYKYSRNGSKVFLDNRIRLIYDDDGKPVAMCGVSTDITERKHAEEKLRKTQEKLEQQNRKLKLLNHKLNASNKRITEINEELNLSMKKAAESDRKKSVFLANMSHEIRTPMNGIIGFTNLLKKADLPDDKRQFYLRIVEESGKRMLSLIDNIIDISKIEAGLMEVNAVKTDVNILLGRLYDFFMHEAEAKGLALNLQTARQGDDCQIETDPAKLEQIISNLVKNAIKFTGEGRIDFGYTVQEEAIEFFVRDTGPGIPREDHEKVFDRFWRGQVGGQAAEDGKGLGLPIVQSLVNLLGGRVWFESKPGRGSAFFVSIPLSGKGGPGSKPAEEAGADHPDATRPGKPVILIAEDDYYSAEYLKALLTPMVSEVFVVQNGKRAVEFCREKPGVDIILMDVKMPVMDGLEATREIRGFNKDVYIIAQTAFALEGDRDNALEAGCNDYLAKPVKADLLRSKIKEITLTG